MRVLPMPGAVVTRHEQAPANTLCCEFSPVLRRRRAIAARRGPSEQEHAPTGARYRAAESA